MISIAFAAESSDVVFVLLERTDTQMFFDWPTGSWVTTPTTFFAAQMIENPKLPGRMTYVAPHQALHQFGNGAPLVLWFFGNTGKVTPARAVIWMEPLTGMVPPFTFNRSSVSLFVSEPSSAF